MIDIKEYLKYCEGRQATLQKNIRNRYANWVIPETGKIRAIDYWLLWVAENTDMDIIPHMRKIESLTEQEAMELIKKGYSPEMWDRIDITEMCKYHIEYTDGSSWHGDGVSELNEFVLYYNQLSPAQFHYLTTIGIAWWATEEMWEKGLLIEVKPDQAGV